MNNKLFIQAAKEMFPPKPDEFIIKGMPNIQRRNDWWRALEQQQLQKYQELKNLGNTTSDAPDIYKGNFW